MIEFETFPQEVDKWGITCLGEEIARDPMERSERLLEEALEAVQSVGYDRELAHKLVDFVYDRPAGEPHQEVGGLMICIAAFCNATGINLGAAAHDELERIKANMDKIREKHKLKPSSLRKNNES